MPWFKSKISIHAPRGGSDLHMLYSICGYRNFNPRSPRGERPAGGAGACWCDPISIHAPRGGSDVHTKPTIIICFVFQSTLPAGGATLD